MKVLPPDTGRDLRRQQDAQRLARYDHDLAALVPFLRALADRLDRGEATPADVDRLRSEAHLLARCLPPDLPLYPEG